MESKRKPPSSDKSLQNLSLSVGNFIRYWGFRRIHGAIWTQLYLSKTPLSCADLTGKLGLSKALISPALVELCRYKLISEAPAPNQKVKVYEASDNISEVIRHILRSREAKMLKQITRDFSSFKKNASDEVDQKHMESLGEMIFSANLMLEMMLDQKDLTKLPTGLES